LHPAGRRTMLVPEPNFGAHMYLIVIILLVLVFPVASVIIETRLAGGTTDVMWLIGKWFVLWSVGVRLFIAGLRQTAQPQFTAEAIFAIKDRGALPIVREIGFANLAMGTLGLLSFAKSGFVVPAAIVGGLYYGLAGIGHLIRSERNFDEWTALISDVFMFVVLAVFVAMRGF
jgi:hypothetical protein